MAIGVHEGVLLASGIGLGAVLSRPAGARSLHGAGHRRVPAPPGKFATPASMTVAAVAPGRGTDAHSHGTGPIAREQCCLIVVDVQYSFIDKLPLDWREPLIERIAYLMKVAEALQIPMVATAEDIEHDGPLVSTLQELLPANAPPVFDKMIFGLASQPEILAAVEATERNTVVLVGLETDVCILQSALGLQQRGYRVVVVTDATASPSPHHEHGLDRLRQADITLTSTKSLFYEWMADLATLGQLRLPGVPSYDSFRGGSPMNAVRYTL